MSRCEPRLLKCCRAWRSTKVQCPDWPLDIRPGSDAKMPKGCHGIHFGAMCLWSFENRKHGSLNVPIEHHPTIRYMVYNGYYKVMSNIPKMGHLLTPGKSQSEPENANCCWNQTLKMPLLCLKKPLCLSASFFSVNHRFQPNPRFVQKMGSPHP